MLNHIFPDYRRLFLLCAGASLLASAVPAQESAAAEQGGEQEPDSEESAVAAQDPNASEIQPFVIDDSAADEDDTESADDEPEPELSTEEAIEKGQEELEERLPSLDEAVPFEWSWKNVGGMLTGSKTFTLKDDLIRFRLGTVVQIDGTTGTSSTLAEERYGPVEQSFNARRFRLSGHGNVSEMDFKIDFELGSNPGFRDAWVENQDEGLTIWGTDLGKFRLGQSKEPFSFERQTSGSYTDFMERALPVQTFSPGHNIGGMVHGVTDDRRQSWALGVFSLGQTTEENSSNSLFSITGRWTGLAIYEDEGRQLLHFGASLSSRNPGSDEVEYFARPEARYVDPMAGTGAIEASDVLLLGAEIAGVYNHWWGQAEWVQTRVSSVRSENPWFEGAYAQVGYTFTGNSRPYRRGGGVFDRFRPELDAISESGLAALHKRGIEIVGRVSGVNLDDGPVRGGRLLDYSLALNLYMSSNTRVQFNYIYAQPSTGGVANLFLLRLQFSPW